MNTTATDSAECQPTVSPVENENDGALKQLKIAYIMSWFPKLTETFVLREMAELEKCGCDIELFPLRKGDTSLMHDAAKPYVDRAFFTPFISLPILLANLAALFTHPWIYLSTLWIIIKANWGSRRYLAGGVMYFPKAVLFAREMRRRKVQHVHAHFASHPAAVAFVIHRLTGISYSFTAHGSDLHRDQHMLREKTVAADFVVAISEYNRDMIVEISGDSTAEKVIVIHCGIDLQRFPGRTSATPYERGKDPFAITCIGTLHEVKGQKYLIEACGQLKQRGIDFRCHLLGDGPDKAMLKQVAEKANVQSEVLFHGYCQESRVREILSETDVLVTPSVFSQDGRREGIPVVLIEAMASEIACVASSISGIPELVEDQKTGILVPPNDSNSIANSVAILIQEEPQRIEMGKAGRVKIINEFDLRANALKLGHQFAQTIQSSLSGREAVE